MHKNQTSASGHIVVLINDFFPEYDIALDKLSKILNRKLKGIILIDSGYKKSGLNKKITGNNFTEVECDFSSLKDLGRTINSIKNDILLITSGSERNQPYFKKVIPHLPYHATPTEQSLEWATHKALMRELLHSYNPELVPKFIQVYESSPRAVSTIENSTDYPVILKPTGLAASILVNKANNREELVKFLESSFAVMADTYGRDFGRGKPSMVVEEFIDGEMYSVDAYINNEGTVWCAPPIRVITAHSIGKEGFYSIRRDTMINLSEDDVAAAFKASEDAVKSLGLRSCVAHIELYKTANGWKIIELGPRAGGYRQDMYLLGYGFDHALNEMLLKLGREPQIKRESIAYCSAINIYPEREGRIAEINGFEEAKSNKSVYWLNIHAKKGDIAKFSGNGGKYIVDGVLSNDDMNELESDIANVRSTIKISIT